jgi:hypothetical protein
MKIILMTIILSIKFTLLCGEFVLASMFNTIVLFAILIIKGKIKSIKEHYNVDYYFSIDKRDVNFYLKHLGFKKKTVN